MERKSIKDHEYSKFFLDENNESVVRVLQGGGQSINPLAKHIEASYSVGDTVITYDYYNSSAKTTLYNTITLTFAVAQDTSFTSASWT